MGDCEPREFDFANEKVAVFQKRLNGRVHVSAVVSENFLNLGVIALDKSVHSFLLFSTYVPILFSFKRGVNRHVDWFRHGSAKTTIHNNGM
jgi:hypothetical protein